MMKKGVNIVVRCHCSKEVEIEKIHSNIALIQKDIQEIKETLCGNGHEGLIDVTERHEKYIVGQEAQMNIIKFLVGGGVIFSLMGVAISILV